MTEEDRLMRRINQRFMKGVMKYNLIEEGDRILVGLSGGKDSLALLELLALRSRIYKRSSTRRPTTGNLRVSCVRGTGERRSSPWPRSTDATKSRWGTTWTTFWRLCS